MERLIPRSFTGLTDEEWQQFTLITKDMLGRGKRSFFCALLVKKTIECHRWSFERQAKIEQRAEHAVNDTFKAITGHLPKEVYNAEKTDLYQDGRGVV